MNNNFQLNTNATPPSGPYVREVATREEFLERWKPVLEAPSIRRNSLWFFLVSIINSLFTGGSADSSHPFSSIIGLLGSVFLFRIIYSLVVWRKFHNEYIALYGPRFRDTLNRRKYLLSYFGISSQGARSLKPSPSWMLKSSTLPLPVLSTGLAASPPLTNHMEVRTKEEFLDRWNSRLFAPALPYAWLILVSSMSISGNFSTSTKETPFYGLAILFSFIVLFGLFKTVYSSIRWVLFIKKHKDVYGKKLLNISRHKHALQKHFGITWREAFEYRMKSLFKKTSPVTSNIMTSTQIIPLDTNHVPHQNQPITSPVVPLQPLFQPTTSPVSGIDYSLSEIPLTSMGGIPVVTTPGLSYGTPIDMRVVQLNSMDPQRQE